MLDVKDKNVLVLGLGVSGYAAAELLARRGATVSISESSDNEGTRKYLDSLAPYSVRFEIGGHTAEFCRDAEIVVTSPGVNVSSLISSGVLREGVPVMGEMELGFQFCRAPVIAITGTNGKSTTTELVGRILSLSGRHTVVCGNIGNPLCGEVDNIKEDSVVVAEVSSFQLETINDFKPRVAVLLNISEDHYGRHGNYDNYRREKFRIFSRQDEEDWAVVHSDLHSDPFMKDIKSRLCFFGRDECGAIDKNGRMNIVISGLRDITLNVDEIPLRGLHNLNNVACAALVCGILGVDDRYIREGIRTFNGLCHRFEKAGIFRGVEFIDDSKATNIDATRRALESMDKKTVLIAGGRDKGGDYLSIMPLVKDKVKGMVLIGEAREKIKAAFSSVIPVMTAETMKEAVETASGMAEEGEAVMLSPMCSSFDMFSGYKERGEAFQREVIRLQT